MVRRLENGAHPDEGRQEVKITMADVRAAKMCRRGAQEFLRRHGISWQDFLASGVDEQRLIETGDAMALKVVEVARGRLK